MRYIEKNDYTGKRHVAVDLQPKPETLSLSGTLVVLTWSSSSHRLLLEQARRIAEEDD